MLWFLCVANVYIDPMKKHHFFIQPGEDADGHSLSLYVDFLIPAINTKIRIFKSTWWLTITLFITRLAWVCWRASRDESAHGSTHADGHPCVRASTAALRWPARQHDLSKLWPECKCFGCENGYYRSFIVHCPHVIVIPRNQSKLFCFFFKVR